MNSIYKTLDPFWAKALNQAKHDKSSSSDPYFPKLRSSQKNYVLSAFPDIYVTRRETDCLRLLQKKLTNKEISENLNISVRTVEFYMNNIKMKFQVSKRSQLMALFEGIII